MRPELITLYRLGSAVVFVRTDDGLSVSVHRQRDSGQLWTVVEGERGATGVPLAQSPAAYLVNDALVTAGHEPAGVEIEVELSDGRAQRVRPSGADGVWVAVFAWTKLPVSVTVRALDGAGALIEEHALAVSTELSGRRRRWRLAQALRLQVGRIPRRTHDYP